MGLLPVNASGCDHLQLRTFAPDSGDRRTLMAPTEGPIRMRGGSGCRVVAGEGLNGHLRLGPSVLKCTFIPPLLIWVLPGAPWLGRHRVALTTAHGAHLN